MHQPKNPFSPLLQCFVITLVAYFGGHSAGFWSLGFVFEGTLYQEMLCALNIVCPFFVAFLMFKGLYAPSSTDSSSNGSWLMDWYWGTELHPRIFGWDVKQFTNCRWATVVPRPRPSATSLTSSVPPP